MIELAVWYGSLPETNGKENWTVMLHRKGESALEGITQYMSEYPGRAKYEADRLRHLIGEIDWSPDILAYDTDTHSGYKPIETPAPAPGPLMRYKVTIEYPGGDDLEYVEATSMEEAEDMGKDAFFNVCNYGVHEIGEVAHDIQK
jgi:hypothetical protein